MRSAVFTKVETGGELEDVDDRALQLAHLRRDRNFLQHAVDAVAHAQVVGQRLDVDVGGTLAQGLADHLIDEFFDRSFF